MSSYDEDGSMTRNTSPRPTTCRPNKEKHMPDKPALPPVGPIPADHWYAESPILIEALAAAVHASIIDICEQLEANTMEEHVNDEAAVAQFLDDYITTVRYEDAKVALEKHLISMAGGDGDGIADILAAHQKVSMGMTDGSPDTCRCGAQAYPERSDAEVTLRRDVAFGAHQAEMLSAAGFGKLP